jgi:hypothetical protein
MTMLAVVTPDGRVHDIAELRFYLVPGELPESAAPIEAGLGTFAEVVQASDTIDKPEIRITLPLEVEELDSIDSVGWVPISEVNTWTLGT